MRLCRPALLSTTRRPGPRERTGIVPRTLRGGVHAQCGFSEKEPVNGLLIWQRHPDFVMILSEHGSYGIFLNQTRYKRRFWKSKPESLTVFYVVQCDYV